MSSVSKHYYYDYNHDHGYDYDYSQYYYYDCDYNDDDFALDPSRACENGTDEPNRTKQTKRTETK